MGMKFHKTVYLPTQDGMIKITPHGRRGATVTAPGHVKITDKRGKPLTKRKPRP